MKGKYYYQVFFTLLIAVSSCLLTASFRAGVTEKAIPIDAEEEAFEPLGYIVRSSFSGMEFPFEPAFMVLNLAGDDEFILSSYRDHEIQEEVLAFFQSLTGSREVADIILFYASIYNIPPALAFSLCAEESGYNPRAYNRNENETVDRGLFQLNSATFPKLEVDDFYDPAKNVRYGLSHLRWCLDTAGTDVAALAMYNAGERRVSSVGTPRKTLDYVSRILKRQQKIEGLFMAEYIRFARPEIAERDNDDKNRTPFRFKLLMPLGGSRGL